MYQDREYANSRLAGTVVMHSDTPVIVLSINRDMVCTCINGQEEFSVHLDELNLVDFKLGWVNTHDGGAYLARKPMRSCWRQGLRPRNIQILAGSRIRVDNGSITKCLKGDFPDEKVALRLACEHKYVAISRDLAISSGRGNLVVVLHKYFGKCGVYVDGEFVKDDDYMLEVTWPW